MLDDRIMQQIDRLEQDANYEGAFGLCTNALKAEPNNPDLLEKTAMISKMVGNIEKSIECWEKLIEISPSSQVAYYELQDLYQDRDRFKYYMVRAKYRIIEQKPEAAVGDFQKAIANTDDEKAKTETRFLIASIYKATGKPDKAENQYLMILDSEPNTMASILLADIYINNNDIDAAISTLLEACKHDENNLDLKRSLGNLYLKIGDTQNASKYITDDFSNVKLLLQEGKNEQAKEVLDTISKKDGQYYLLLAEYYYNKQDTKECFNAIDEFTKLTPRHPLTFQMRALCYELEKNEGRAKYNWGWYNLMKGQKDVALAEFLDSNNIEKSVDTLEQIIRIYDEQNDKTTAAEFVEQLVELEPNNTLALKRLGEFYQSLGDADNAYMYYSKILSYDPNNISVLKNAAKMAEKIGEEDKAMDYYKRITEISKDINEKLAAQKRLNIMTGAEDESIITKFLDWIKKF